MSSIGRLVLACAFSALTPVVSAQLVSDGATNIINNTTNIVPNNLVVGANGGRTALIITNSALVVVRTNATIGNSSGAFTNLVKVTGANSRFGVGSDLVVGQNGRGNHLLIEAGASATNNPAFIGVGFTASNNLALVTGSASSWTHRSGVTVGAFGAANHLVISNGATVLSGAAIVGFSSSHNTAHVTGTGSVWRIGAELATGWAGPSNQVIISDGAIVSATVGYVGFTPDSTNNRLRIQGGLLIVTNNSQTSPLEVRGGAVQLSGGSIDADHLLVSGLGSSFAFTGGSLAVNSSAISNGVPFVVGDGTNRATLHLVEGTNSFANGLIISSNATLSGCGSIYGFVINHGLIRADCPGEVLTFHGALTNYATVGTGNGGQLEFLGTVVNNGVITTNSTVSLLNPHFTNQTFSFSFATESGVGYVIEFKNNLNSGIWTTLTNLSGDGGIGRIRDDSPVPDSRYYRVRTQ